MRVLRLFAALSLIGLLAACGGQVPPTQTPAPIPTSAPTTAAAAPTEPPAPSPTPAPPTEAPTDLPAPTDPPVEDPATPTAANDDSPGLPAPLYYIASFSGAPQIYRLAAIGEPSTQITDEPAGVDDYDISPADGALVYISGNDLILADAANPPAAGGSRTVLVDGADLPPDDFDAAQAEGLRSPRWSPDGSQIAFEQGGITIIDPAGQVVQSLLPHKLQDDPGMAELFKYKLLYNPESWSPDGAKLLVNYSWVPEGGGWLSVDLATSEAITITQDEGLACCWPVWSLSGALIYYSNAQLGIIPAGLWEADTQTGGSTRLLGGAQGAAPWALVSEVLPVGNDAFLAFYLETTDEMVANGNNPQLLQMSQINADGSVVPLRTDAYEIGEARWAIDGSGAAVVTARFAEGPLLWLPSDGGAAVDLGANGANLRWGR